VEQKRVAFIAADTFRIGAVEQLQTYAQLLDIPMTVAYCLEDVEAACERYAGCDLILLDTVGRPPGNRPQLDELSALLQVARPDEVHLALDARGSYATHSVVMEGFRTLRPTHLLLSKLDETPRLEDSLAAALEGGLPISYVTTGQRVPEDLAAADSAQLATWLLGGG
jgi:flagellar biosynthesis protein FlhF